MNKQRKIIIIGNGAIGSSYAFMCLNRGVARTIGIIDIDKKRVAGDIEDLSDALPYSEQTYLYSADYSDCKEADMIIITAGVPQKEGETRLDLINNNSKIMKSIIKQIKANEFKGILIVASNPVDVLTQLAIEESGLSPQKVIGTGTALDTSRLRTTIANHFHIDARNIHGYILGEHGDSEFPVWKYTTVGVSPIKDWLAKNDYYLMDEFSDRVKNAAYRIIENKGATNYGIAAILVKTTSAILNDENCILPLSVQLNGEYDLRDVCIGVPVVIGRNGVEKIIELDLEKSDLEKLQDSARILKLTYEQIQRDKD